MKTLIFIASFFLLNTCVFADLIGIQRPIAFLKPLSKPEHENRINLKVRIWVDRRSQTYSLGESIQFFVTVNKDSYITLLDIGTTGKTHIIFPNKLNENNFVKAGTIVSVPPTLEKKFTFKVSGSKGVEVIKAIATTEKIEILPEEYLSKKSADYMEVIAPLRIVAKSIDATLNDSSKNIEWSEYTKLVNIR